MAQTYYTYTDNKGRTINDFRLTDRQLYKGNPLAKREGVELPYEQYHIDEWVKCANDPIYFLETYVKIVHIDYGVVPFKLYDYQRDLIRKFQDNRFVAALQCRQSGKSTVVGGFLLWVALFQSNKEMAILANKAAQAKEIVKRVADMMTYVPFFLKPGMTALNKQSLRFDNGSEIFSAATSSDSIRGRSCVTGDSLVTVRNKVTGEIETLPIAELMKRCGKAVDTSKMTQGRKRNDMESNKTRINVNLDEIGIEFDENDKIVDTDVCKVEAKLLNF